MKVIDPGHEYLLASLDGEQVNQLVFVKREGPGYPGNAGHHPGTTMQECLRALIDRASYVNGQIPCSETAAVIYFLRHAIFLLEVRAAGRHKRRVNFSVDEAVQGPYCSTCGHVGCKGECHRALPARGSGEPPTPGTT